MPWNALRVAIIRPSSATCPAGTRYLYRLDDGRELPDPASRFQPEGVHGPSQLSIPVRSAGPITTGKAGSCREAFCMNFMSGHTREKERSTALIPHLADLADLGVTTASKSCRLLNFPDHAIGDMTESTSMRRRTLMADRRRLQRLVERHSRARLSRHRWMWFTTISDRKATTLMHLVPISPIVIEHLGVRL